MNERKRVLYIEKPPFIGGSITGLFELVRGLDQSRYEPIVLFCSPNPFREEFRKIGVRVETLSDDIPPMGRNKRDIAGSLGRVNKQASQGYSVLKDFYRFARRDYPIGKQVARLIQEWGIDLVHHNNCLRTDRATVYGARLARVPQIVHVRSLRPFGLVEKYLARSVKAFVYMSRAVETLYREHGIPAQQGAVIYDGFVPPKSQAHTDSHAQDVRQQFGLGQDDFVISNVGRIEWWKGHDYFVQSMAEVVEREPKTKALLVGGVDSTMRNAAFHGRVQEMVQQLGLSQNIIFTGFRSDVAQIMAMSDLIVHSASEPEPFGRVVVEAMLAARPVVATAAGGVLDIVEDQVTGLTVPPKDSPAMSGAIQYLLQNPNMAHTMGQRARQEATRRFSVEQHVAKIHSLYEKVLSE